MIFKRIRCIGCGHEGPREMSDSGPVESKADMFTNQGHNPYSGKIYFCCPQCETFVAVDPIDALEKDVITGHPCPLETEVAKVTRTHGLLSLWSGMYALLVIFILVTRISC